MNKSVITSLLAAAALAASSSPASADELKYIFYFIGDGMGMGHVMATECYNRTVLGNTDPILMLRFPVASAATTYSASSPVTDSAAAGTALATGHKTANGMLGMTPDSTAVTSIATILHDRGYGVGLVTSVAADDATPGAFYAHQPSRSMYYEIGSQAASSGFEFIAGSGLKSGRPRDGQPSDIYRVFEQNNVTVTRGVESLDTVTSRRVLLIGPEKSEPNNIGYTIDSVAGALTLPSMTAACLSHLEKNAPERFFMMVEGGNIDHAGHGNDAGTVIKEILNFQEAIAVAYDFYNAHPSETLIVITADHNTGGMALGNTAVGYDARLRYIDSQRVSKGAFSDFCKSMLQSRRGFRWDDMEEYLRVNLGFWTDVPVSEEQTEALRRDFEATFDRHETTDTKTLYDSFNDFAVKVFNILDSTTGIGWTSVHHTGDFVPVYAAGNGSQAFTGVCDNTAIPGKILEIVNREATK